MLELLINRVEDSSRETGFQHLKVLNRRGRVLNSIRQFLLMLPKRRARVSTGLGYRFIFHNTALQPQGGLDVFSSHELHNRKSGPGLGVPSVVCAWTPLPVPDFHPGG